MLAFSFTALLAAACSSTAGTHDGGADASPRDVVPPPPCTAGIEWLDPVPDPPMAIANRPQAGITGLRTGGFAVFHWDEARGGVARQIGNQGAIAPSGGRVAEWAGAPISGGNFGGELWVGESARGVMLGLFRADAGDVAWAALPAEGAAWGPVTTLQASARRGANDLVFLDDRVAVSREDLVIGMGAVSGIDVDLHDLASGALLEHQVWAMGAWPAGYYIYYQGPVLLRDGAGVVALEPPLSNVDAGVGVYRGPGAPVRLAPTAACCGAFQSALGPGGRVWVMHSAEGSPRLRVDRVEGASAAERVWTSEQVPQGGGEFAIAPAGEGAVLAYWDDQGLRVTVIDRDGAVRATSSLPVRLAPDYYAWIALAAGTEDTYAAVWGAADRSHAGANVGGGIARFRACAR